MGVRMTTPVTILTGFLGCGKTTLINRILQESVDERVAVIENEYGEVGVDAEFLSRTGNETIIQLENGCLCCTVRGDLAQALYNLVQQADANNLLFDRVLIETTGLADPGPILQTFLAETAIEQTFHLDGIVTVVDAENALIQRDRIEFRTQIGYADRIVVSKEDRVNNEQLSKVNELVAKLNPRAPLSYCDLHTVTMPTLFEHLFHIRGFAIDYIPPEEVARAQEESCGHDHDHEHGDCGSSEHAHGEASHTDDVVSCVFTSDIPIDLSRLNIVLDGLIGRYGEALWRCKGVINSRGHRSRLVLQGVQGLIQIGGGVMWRPYEPRRSVLVFIGQNLDADLITEALKACEEGAVAAR
ncbi:MAG TPA: GTP-binding protein [Burkholderiaceae bacterium]|nr:GTP-binding protein [Burkholderiaceae bacterium]